MLAWRCVLAACLAALGCVRIESPDAAVVTLATDARVEIRFVPALADGERVEASLLAGLDTGDVVAALDWLLESSADPDSPFHDLVDPDRLGLVGWSFGGRTVVRTIPQEPRFRAGLALAASYAPVASFVDPIPTAPGYLMRRSAGYVSSVPPRLRRRWSPVPSSPSTERASLAAARKMPCAIRASDSASLRS